ncbi:MAG: 4Fe-4S dicluster domain-containing protein [Synergistaceae bacterium]|nr:4Fe-4S dicluster domain-containing protein [Synergistaceae bacterium]
MDGCGRDLDFKNEVVSHSGGERALNCFLCGTCTAGCPISELDGDFDPRLIMRRILAGMRDEVLGDGGIWKCYQCHACVAHCPQDARFADIIRALREISVERGYFSEELALSVEKANKEYRGKLLEHVKNLLPETSAR